MASIRFNKEREQWEIRKHITHPKTKEVRKLYRMLPRGARQSDALEVAAAFERAAFQIKMGTLETAITIKAAFQKWFLTAARCLTERTQYHYLHTMEKFMQFLPQSAITVDQVTAKDINDFLETILKDRTARTANSQLTTIKSFFRWCSRTFDLSNPASRVYFLREEPANRRFFSAEEYERIMAGCTNTTREMFLFLSNTGLRVSEFIGLKWLDIETDFSSFSIIGKGRKRRTLPLNQTCREILQLRLADKNDSGYVFVSKSSNPHFFGRPMTSRGLYNTCAGIAKRLGIEAFGPHAFRHWFATELLKRDLPLFKVSLLMGHSSTKLTQSVYAHILPGDLKNSTDVLDQNNRTQSKGEQEHEGREEYPGNSGGTISIVGYKKQIAAAAL